MDNNYFWFYSFDMKKGILDNNYYFYDNGKILHVYDKTLSKLNIEEYVSASDIPENERLQIIENCPPEFKEQIMEMISIKTNPQNI